jgi:hypothetical protein
MFRRMFQSLFGRAPAPLKSHKRRKRKDQAALNFESLEERCVLTSTLYVDFGDNFGAGLTGTIGALRNSVAPGSTVNVNGPTMPNLTTGLNFSDPTTFVMNSFNSVYGAQATQMRADIMTLVRRFYEPLDVTVVELTSANQLVNGFNVRGAASLNDISLTMNLNEAAAKNNDNYVLVGNMFIGVNRYNPGYDGLVGIADDDDLLARSNLRDDTSVVTLADNFWSTDILAFGIAHEAAHNFGLRHTFGNFPSAAAGFTNAIYESDIMSYLAGGNFGAYSMFTRYPLAIGDGNLNPNLLSAFPTPYDQMANDSQIGASNVGYITGTGAYDIITVTRSGANANVTVQAFSNAGYTGAINVPFFGGTTFSYSVSLANPLLIDAGVRSDRILIDASLGQQVLVRGMGGITGNFNDADELVIFGSAGSATYTPGTNAALGLDGHTDYRGTVTVGTTVVRFQEFDLGSSVSFSAITNVTVQTPLGGDNLTIDTLTFNGNLNQRVAGTTGGVFIVPLYFRNATTFTIDSATADALGGDDVILVNAWIATLLNSVIINTGDGNDGVILGSFVASAVTSVTVNTGAGNDAVFANAWSPSQTTMIWNLGTEDDLAVVNAPFAGTALTNLTVVGDDGDDDLQVNLNSFLMTGGNLISYDGGDDFDTISTSNDVATMTLSNNLVTSSGGGTIPLTSVENAVLTGGGSANSFVLNNWNGTGATINGGAGIDNLTIQQGAQPTATYTPSNSAAAGLAGDITLPALAIDFTGFDATSTMTLQDVTALTVQTLGGADALTIDSPSAGRNRVTGTTAGVIVAPLQFFNLTSLIVDSGNGDTATHNDSITLGSLVAAGLQNVSLSTGLGNDVINIGTAFTGTTIRNVTLTGGDGDDRVAISLDNYVLPVGGGAFTFDGGLGTDAIQVTNNVTTMTLTTTTLTSSSGGSLGYTSVETAALTGGIGNNAFNVSAWNGTSLALVGAAGTDTFTFGSGNLDTVSGLVAIDAGTGSGDALVLNDNGNALVADYTIAATTVSTVLGTGVARTFGTLSYDAALEFITINGTTGVNNFFVKPSITTTMTVNGNSPVGATGDRLQVDFIGTGNRTLNNVGGNGSWTFPGSGTPLFGVRSPINFTSIEKVNSELAFGSAGSDPGTTSAPWVKFVDLISGEVVEFLAYESTFRGGVSVVTADVTGDGVPEIITAPGRGRAPEIRVFTRFGTELTAFRTMAFAASDFNGVNIAVADVNGDLRNDIIAVRGRGVTEVRVFRNDFGVNADPIANDAIYRFNAFPTSFIGGASVTAGDMNADGRAEIIVGSGSGQAAVINVFDPTTLPLIAPAAATPAAAPTAFAQYTNFYDAAFLGGVSSMSVGRINGDTIPDIIVGQGQGGNSLVALLDGASGRRLPNGTFNPTVQVATQFSAYSDTGSMAAIYVAGRDSDADGIIDMIFTGQASDGRTRGVIRVFKPFNPVPPGSVPLFGTIEFAGITVG